MAPAWSSKHGFFAAGVFACAVVSTAEASVDAPATASSLPNPTKCAVGSAIDGEVKNLTDGTYNRCFSIITPRKAELPMPVLFWFHGSGGNAAGCGTHPLVDIARQHGFALVCAEGLQLPQYGAGGHWTIPEIQTDETGPRCGVEDSPDVAYIHGVIQLLGEARIYDTKRLFFSGCSMGSAMSIYTGNCLKAKMPDSVSAFATHSTGLKVKGDGLDWKPDIYRPQYITGECPECQYFPIVPRAFNHSLGLKACIFDNTEDPDGVNPYFYHSSVALGDQWSRYIPYDAITACLDDGTGRLLGRASSEELFV